MKKRSRVLVAVLVVVVIINVIVKSQSGPTTRDDAVQNLIHKIDSGPSWETQQMSDAVGGYLKWQETNNGNDGGGGCAYVNGRDASAGFACYLQASVANGEGTSYFSENKSGGDIRPINRWEYDGLIGG